MGMMDYVIVGGVLVGGYLLLFTDTFANLLPPAAAGGDGGGGEFIDPGTGTVTPGGEFISGSGVEQSYEGNSQSECSRRYNGKCREDCKGSKYGTAECADCLAVCGAKAYGCRTGYCWSYGLKECRACGTTSSSALSAQCVKDYGAGYCWSLGAKSCVRCGSTAPGVKETANCKKNFGNNYCYSVGARTCVVCGSTSSKPPTTVKCTSGNCYSNGLKKCVKCGSTAKPKATNPPKCKSGYCYSNGLKACVKCGSTSKPPAQTKMCYSNGLKKYVPCGSTGAGFFYDEPVEDLYFSNLAVSV